MAIVTARFSLKEFISAFGACRIEIDARHGFRFGKGQLIKVKSRQLRGDPIVVGISAYMAEVVCRGNRKLRRVIQSRIEECSDAVHLEVRYKSIPIRDGSPRAGPGMLVVAGEVECIGN